MVLISLKIRGKNNQNYLSNYNINVHNKRFKNNLKKIELRSLLGKLKFLFKL